MFAMPPPPLPSPVSLEEARARGQAAASGQELGDLFEYKLKDRVTLKKNVPLTLMNTADGTRYVLRFLSVGSAGPAPPPDSP